jgi:hypothetical protein
MKIESVQQLREIYAEPTGRAVIKSLSSLEKHCLHFINTSPFLVISSFNKNGNADTSPRGGAPGFVKVLDAQRIAIPDAKGNRRQDSQINIIETGKIATLFFIPGVNETLRINGSACIKNDADVLTLFTGERNPPQTYIEISVEEAFLHCAKALMRSGLWSAETKIQRDQFPSMSRMINDQLGSDEPEESQAAMEARYADDL